MTLPRLLDFWSQTPQIAENITAWRQVPARRARFVSWPEDLLPDLIAVLRLQGIDNLYAHQMESLQLARQGQNVVVVTGTASGKTLCYNLPVLERLTQFPEARALYLFPTKALSQDQFHSVHEITGQLAQNAVPVSVYDGDTPRGHRPAIRELARLLITNPDMLHTGILPYHTRWAEFFVNLHFIVLDEIHIYRGVFGSHIANVLRRLKRIAAHYGAAPQFIVTSATIGNPVQHAEKLLESRVTLVEEDGSSRGKQNFLIYNPPIVNPDLSIRRGVLQETVYLAGDLLAYDVQTLIFARSRRAVELTLTYLREMVQPAAEGEQVRAYRSGYLPAQRRAIEAGLRAGSVRAVAATNALELGVDIGGMGAVLLAGFPGTFAATWQQAGRAGRGSDDSLAVLLTSANPLDQFLARQPDYFFERTPEQALINPDNLLILLDHIRCAAYELPFRSGEGFGLLPGDEVDSFLDFLTHAGQVHLSGDGYYWMAEAYPAQEVSLRNASARRVLLQEQLESGEWRTIGEVDGESATWMVHPGAIYLHEGEMFLVETLDLEKARAELSALASDYYTEPRSETEIHLIEQKAEYRITGGVKAHGEIQVTTQITGFQKVRWQTHERLGNEALDLPPSQLQTSGFWLGLGEETLQQLREQGLWGSDANDYGPQWAGLREIVRARDGYRCQNCGREESGRAHDVHHRIPFRSFDNAAQANRLSNLITLCQSCHRRAETVVRMRSGLAGLAFLLEHLAPLFLMCDRSDLGWHSDPQSALTAGQPTIVVYERIPAGIGFSQRLYEVHDQLLGHALEVVLGCPCPEGCPSCVGPGGELGAGSKRETQALLEILVAAS